MDYEQTVRTGIVDKTASVITDVVVKYIDEQSAISAAVRHQQVIASAVGAAQKANKAHNDAVIEKYSVSHIISAAKKPGGYTSLVQENGAFPADGGVALYAQWADFTSKLDTKATVSEMIKVQNAPAKDLMTHDIVKEMKMKLRDYPILNLLLSFSYVVVAPPSGEIASVHVPRSEKMRIMAIVVPVIDRLVVDTQNGGGDGGWEDFRVISAELSYARKLSMFAIDQLGGYPVDEEKFEEEALRPVMDATVSAVIRQAVEDITASLGHVRKDLNEFLLNSDGDNDQEKREALVQGYIDKLEKVKEEEEMKDDNGPGSLLVETFTGVVKAVFRVWYAEVLAHVHSQFSSPVPEFQADIDLERSKSKEGARKKRVAAEVVRVVHNQIEGKGDKSPDIQKSARLVSNSNRLLNHITERVVKNDAALVEMRYAFVQEIVFNYLTGMLEISDNLEDFTVLVRDDMKGSDIKERKALKRRLQQYVQDQVQAEDIRGLLEDDKRERGRLFNTVKKYADGLVYESQQKLRQRDLVGSDFEHKIEDTLRNETLPQIAQLTKITKNVDRFVQDCLDAPIQNGSCNVRVWLSKVAPIVNRVLAK